MKKLLLSAVALCTMASPVWLFYVPAFAGWFSTEAPACDDPVVTNLYTNDIIKKMLDTSPEAQLVTSQIPGLVLDWDIQLEHAHEFQSYQGDIQRRFCGGELSVKLNKNWPSGSDQGMTVFLGQYITGIHFPVQYTVSLIDGGNNVYVQTYQ